MSSDLTYLPVQKSQQLKVQLPKGISSLRSLNGDRLTKLISNSAFEFRELKNYTEGDSLKNIHWKTGARIGNLMVKTFFEEQRQDYCFILDTSASMLSGTEEPILQNAIDICYWLLKDCRKNKFKSSCIWDDKSSVAAKPETLSNASLNILYKNLYSLKTIEYTWNISPLLTAFTTKRISSTNIILISSGAWIENIHSETIRQINSAQRKNRVFLLGLFPIDHIPSSGIYILNDPSTGQICEIDFSYKPAVEYISQQRQIWKKKMQRFCSSNNINFLTL